MELPRGEDELRARLARARLMLLFTPEVCPSGRDPLAALRAALPHLDAVQVRIKPLGGEDSRAPAPARETHDRALAVLELVARERSDALVLVDDRVDVALALARDGVAGVHLGQDDLPPAEARAILGDDLLLGLSTHDGRDLARAADEPVDYLGFGPVWGTPTKGYAAGKGSEAAWLAAATAAPRPVFAIGGIDTTNAAELAPVGRAAVSAAILAADDPAAAARALREILAEGDAAV